MVGNEKGYSHKIVIRVLTKDVRLSLTYKMKTYVWCKRKVKIKFHESQEQNLKYSLKNDEKLGEINASLNNGLVTVLS